MSRGIIENVLMKAREDFVAGACDSDWVKSYDLVKVSTPWGWLGTSGDRRARFLFADGGALRRHVGIYAAYRIKDITLVQRDFIWKEKYYSFYDGTIEIRLYPNPRGFYMRMLNRGNVVRYGKTDVRVGFITLMMGSHRRGDNVWHEALHLANGCYQQFLLTGF